MQKTTLSSRTYFTSGRRLLFFAALLLIFAGLMIGLICANINTPVLYMKNGSAVLQESDLSRGVHIAGGEFIRYEGVHEPHELEGLTPLAYTDVLYTRSMEGHTYVFEITAPETLSFLMVRPNSAKVWVNGILINASERYILPTSSYPLSRFGDEGVYRFVIAAPYSTSTYGYRGILVGSEAQLKSLSDVLAIMDIISIGMYVMAIALCLALFFQKRSETYLLLLAAMISLSLLRWLPAVRFPGFNEFPIQLNSSLGKLSSFLRCFFFLQFVPEKKAKALLPAAVACMALWYGCRLLGFASAKSWVYFAYMLVEGGMLTLGLIHRRPGCFVLMCGWCVDACMEVFYLLLNTGMLPQGLIDVYIQPMPYSALLYLTCCCVATFGIFARKYRQADDLSINLEHKVNEQTQQLRTANTELQQAQIDKQHFMADAAHNLRNPLFALGGYIDLLIGSTPHPSPAQQKNIDRINFKLDSINKMVDNILFFSRLEDGNVELELTEFSLPEFLHTAAADAALKGNLKGVTVAVECEPTPAVITADRFHLQQVLDNVLDNAVRYSPAESQIRLCARLSDADTVCLEVIDRGCGMTEEVKENLFSRYSSKGPGGSVGLGLTISREIILRHGGRLTVDSRENEGTCVRMELPLAP